MNTQETGAAISPLAEVLDKIPSGVPEVFKKQASVAAGFIERLDKGEIPQDPNLKVFVDELAHSGFVGNVYVKHEFMGGLDPKEVLPQWLSNVNRDEELAGGDEKYIGASYEKLVQDLDLTSHQEKDGQIYHSFGTKDTSLPISKTFKCYVEGIDLSDAFKAGKMEALLTDLQTQDMEPHDVKLFEGGRLALYYSKDISQSGKIRDTFERFGVNFRGPARMLPELKLMKKEI